MTDKLESYSKLTRDELEDAFNHLYKALHFFEAGLLMGMGVDSGVVEDYECIMDITHDFYELINGPEGELLEEEEEEEDEEEDE